MKIWNQKLDPLSSPLSFILGSHDEDDGPQLYMVDPSGISYVRFLWHILFIHHQSVAPLNSKLLYLLCILADSETTQVICVLLTPISWSPFVVYLSYVDRVFLLETFHATIGCIMSQKVGQHTLLFKDVSKLPCMVLEAVCLCYLVICVGSGNKCFVCHTMNKTKILKKFLLYLYFLLFFQGYWGCAIGKAKQAAKTEIEKLQVNNFFWSKCKNK